MKWPESSECDVYQASFNSLTRRQRQQIYNHYRKWFCAGEDPQDFLWSHVSTVVKNGRQKNTWYGRRITHDPPTIYNGTKSRTSEMFDKNAD